MVGLYSHFGQTTTLVYNQNVNIDEFHDRKFILIIYNKVVSMNMWWK